MSQINIEKSNRVKELREARGLTQASLALQTGLSHSSIVAYENGNREPNARAMAALEKFFSVTGEYLLCLTNENIPIPKAPPISHPQALSQELTDLICLYSELDHRGQTTVLSCLREQHSLSIPHIEAEKPHIIPLRISEQAASAGTGIYLGPDAFSEIDVLENRLTSHADFAVPVSGDSMEPQFHDGDIALVSDDPAEVGDIVIAILQGEGYIKKIGRGKLISLNPKYEPIPLDDSVRICGKVIGILDTDWLQ